MQVKVSTNKFEVDDTMLDAGIQQQIANTVANALNGIGGVTIPGNTTFEVTFTLEKVNEVKESYICQIN